MPGAWPSPWLTCTHPDSMARAARDRIVRPDIGREPVVVEAYRGEQPDGDTLALQYCVGSDDRVVREASNIPACVSRLSANSHWPAKLPTRLSSWATVLPFFLPVAPRISNDSPRQYKPWPYTSGQRTELRGH